MSTETKPKEFKWKIIKLHEFYSGDKGLEILDKDIELIQNELARLVTIKSNYKVKPKTKRPEFKTWKDEK